MYNNSKNKQVRYSLDTLSNSLFYLLLNKDINDITISEVCANSGITRKTFYRNCDDLIDLLCYRIDNEVNQAISKINWEAHDIRLIVLSFFTYWLERKPLLELLHKRQLFQTLSKSMLDILTSCKEYESMTNRINSFVAPEKRYYYDSFVVAGSIQLLETSASRNFDLSAEELTDIYLFFKH